MGDDPRPRRTPGGALPPRLARPRHPESNGHTPHELPGLMPQSWEQLDQEDEERLQAERTAFRRVAEVVPGVEVHASGRPSRAAVIGVLLVAAVVVLAIVLYRMAPP
ncbi:MAG TPA: hypothetical protein VN193_06215 [Candidatus Angelobacter sp.]|jgi:hypothetical protein|nr:hypothetical protein [Candidatus Angelobacter sp.]